MSNLYVITACAWRTARRTGEPMTMSSSKRSVRVVSLKLRPAAQVAIITGSGQGLGAATARLFASEGAKVVITDIDAKKSDERAECAQTEALNWTGLTLVRF
eukprot:9484195-Pyramimonas_sp.AAC.2